MKYSEQNMIKIYRAESLVWKFLYKKMDDGISYLKFLGVKSMIFWWPNSDDALRVNDQLKVCVYIKIFCPINYNLIST